jgi:hypothetical protein
MKKLLSLLMLMGITYTAFAQNESGNAGQGKQLPGTVTLNNGEVKEGFIRRFSKIKSQKKVRFYANVDDKKYIEFKPDEVKSYTVADAFYQSLPYEGFTQKTKVFIERTKAGKLSLFTYYILTSDGDRPQAFTPNKKETSGVELDFTGESLSGEMIMLKENGDQLNLSSPKLLMGFKSVMSKYLAECAILSQKIANKESGYGVLNIIKITDEYNACN